MVEFLARNGVPFQPPSVDATVSTIGRLAAGGLSEHELAVWLRENVR